jgi:hypothetical protein
MGRPLKIQKYSAMSGIMANGSQSASAVSIDQGYPPFAAPTSLDLPTVVLPQPVTSPLPFTGVVGGDYTLSSPSTSYPIVECQVNIALPNGTGQGVQNGRIIRQKGARKFLVASGAAVQDEDIVVGATYQILSLDVTNWQQMGAPAGAVAGTIFTCTALCASPQNGTALLVGQCVLVNSPTPTAGNMSISMATNGDSTAVYVSKLTNRFVQDFHGGETGGNANTGNVWNPAQVVNDIEYAANFFTDQSTFAKSGADVATWAGTNQNSNGTLGLAQVENFTS